MLQSFEMTLMLVKCGPKKNISPVAMKAKSAGGGGGRGQSKK